MAKTEQTMPPAGTGSAPGLGESFGINLSTGQGTFTYQIPLPDGVAKHTPKLTLEYSHGNGAGPFGLGWRLALRSIGRRLDFGVPDSGPAERFLDNGSELMRRADGSYAAMRETAFTRYTRTAGWRIEERNGTVHELGTNAAARVADPDRPDRVLEWLIERSLDVSGNQISYRWRQDGGFAYPDAVTYAIYELRLVYEARPDIRVDGRAGFLRRRNLRCKQLLLVLDPGPGERLIRSYDLAYAVDAVSGISLLSTITLTARGQAADGSEDVRRPPVRLSYSAFHPESHHVRWMSGDGPPPPALTEPDVALVTLDRAPLPGILLNRGGRSIYWGNRGDGTWSYPRPLAHTPLAPSFAAAGLAFVDMDGSGTADLMVANPQSPQGYYANGGGDGWAEFVAFPPGLRATPTWADPHLRLLDADGDGLIDAVLGQKHAFVLWENRGRAGWSTPTLVPKQAAGLDEIDFQDADVHLADMSGDGSLDIVRVRSGRIEYFPNLGRARFGERILMGHSPRLPRGIGHGLILLADLVGDGCADLVAFADGGLIVWPNRNGTGFGDPIVINPVPSPLPGTVRAASLDGRAGAALLWNSPVRNGAGYVQFRLGAEEPPLLLTTIDNGAGLISEIHYRSAIEDFRRDRNAGQMWMTNFPFPYLVVGRTHEVDAVTGRTTDVEMRYHEAHFDRHNRQFEGFRSAERIETGDASRPDTRIVHQFLMAEERKPGHGPEHAALNGLLARIETYQADGSALAARPYRVETAEHGLNVLETAPDGRTRSFVFITAHRQEDSERSGDVRAEQKTFTYDANGNVVTEVLHGSGTRGGVAQPERQRTTLTSYAMSNIHYLLDKPSRVEVRDSASALRLDKRFFYDGPDFVGLDEGQADRGLISREIEWALTMAEFQTHYGAIDPANLGYVAAADADGTASLFVTNRCSRADARGLVVATRDPMGTETRTTFDDSGLFRTSQEDALGVTTFTYDRAHGQITAVTYSTGAVTRFAYDAQGRVLRSALPGQDLATAATVYRYDETVVPNRRVAVMRQAGGATSQGITYFDGRGQEFQQRIEIEPGRWLVSALKLPNPWGDLRAEYEPTFSNSPAFAVPDTAGRPVRRFTYDALGRSTRVENFNGGIATAVFEPFRVTLRDANDNDDTPANRSRGQFDTPHEEEFDVLRYLVQVTERVAADRTIVTSYQVGEMGELIAIADGRGVKLGYRYDRLGNRLAIALRDSGERKSWFDARRSTIRTQDAAGHELSAEFDALGRQLRLSGSAGVIEEYRYDDAAQNAHGKLAEVRFPGGVQTFVFDVAGRLARHEFRYDGEPQVQSLRYEYDPLGRETAVIHTDGTRIERQLMFNGWLKAVPGVVDAISYDPRGLYDEIDYHNGVKATYEYTAGPGRIRRQTTRAADGALLQAVEFTLDRLDLMLARNDTAAGGAGLRTYGYDPLYQLTRCASIENGNPVVQLYDYVGDYNLRRFDEGAATLQYDDAHHPDRLTRIMPDAGAAFLVDYDGNGNLLSLPGRQFIYNVKNELVRMDKSDGLVAEYRYDHLGVRATKTVTAGGTTTTAHYIGDRVEIRDGKPFYFVRVGSMRVAVLSEAPTRWLHDDGMSSTSFSTDETGALAQRTIRRPFGNAVAGSASIDFASFSLHPLDAESGLVYMQRRYYAPELGRFLTPDLMAIYQPEKFLHGPQGLHLYSFVANDPLNKVDPTGLSFWSVVGAIAGVIVGVVVAVVIVAAVVATGGVLGVVLGIALALGAGLLATGVSYLIASNVDPNSAGGQFMRGFMIGFNAGMNGVLAAAIFGPVVGVAVGVINFLAAFDGIAKSPVYQGILGWSSWMMPMSWGVTALGIIFYVVNMIVAGVTFQQWDAAKISKLGFDWKTGTFVMSGGLIRGPTAFNMGNFVFMNPKYVDGSSPDRTYDAVLQHETGHTLNTGAFGSAFEFYDLIGENAVGSGANDYGEELAESHANRPGRPTIPMWG